MQFPSAERVAALNKQYQGKRIELELMPEDPNPIPPGTQGTCEMVDGAGQLIMNWDNGQTLSLIPGVDRFKVN